MNFLDETIVAILNSHHKYEDIDFVSDGEHHENWETFKEHLDFEYDNGYGVEFINPYLKIVFNDGSWIERREYDGSEWWEFFNTPIKPKKGVVQFISEDVV